MMIAVLAFVVDCLIGDPRSSLHPVVLIGKLISFFEGLLYHEQDSDRKKLFCGFVLMVCVLLVSCGVAEGVVWLAALTGNVYVSMGVQAVLLSFMISPRNLAEAGREIRDYLLEGNLEMARFKVGWIVGRDTDKLTEGEATRATVETISENTVDGVISPLFYFFVGGLPLAVAYRAANTMDSMVGYKNDKYLFFGRAAALADSGRRPDFTPPYRIDGLTPFRRDVVDALLAIPFGATATYGDIAAAIARRRGLAKMSAQAVGQAVGWNPICIVVPCHRVVGAAGTLVDQL